MIKYINSIFVGHFHPVSLQITILFKRKHFIKTNKIFMVLTYYSLITALKNNWGQKCMRIPPYFWVEGSFQGDIRELIPFVLYW